MINAEIVHRNGLGRVMVAQCDLPAGAEVFRETEPIIYISMAQLQSCSEAEEFAPFYAAYEIALTKMSPEKKQLFFDLHGPTTGGQADEFRKNMRSMVMQTDEGTSQSFSEDEVEQFVKIASIMRLNAFEYGGGRAIFALATRMSHSCIPNCRIEFTASHCSCRTILPVRAHEELTIEYNCEHRLCFTYERRRSYAQTKDFTCHCARCDAPADDTRQFPCSDPQCAGRHFACQPISSAPLTFPDRAYTDVEYVEPHLLPCTACQRHATAEYQTQMFQQEAHLPSLLQVIQEEYCTLEDFDVAGKKELLSRLEDLQYPALHSRAIKLNDLLLGLRREVHHLTGDAAGMARAGERALRPLDVMAQFPNELWRNHLLAAGRACELEGALGKARGYCARAMRMHLIISGRDSGLTDYHNVLAEVLCKLPQVKVAGDGRDGQAEVCAFCEESPQRASLSLRQCPRCQTASYCSVGCQRAHWKLHRELCNRAR